MPAQREMGLARCGSAVAKKPSILGHLGGLARPSGGPSDDHQAGAASVISPAQEFPAASQPNLAQSPVAQENAAAPPSFQHLAAAESIDVMRQAVDLQVEKGWQEGRKIVGTAKNSNRTSKRWWPTSIPRRILQVFGVLPLASSLPFRVQQVIVSLATLGFTVALAERTVRQEASSPLLLRVPFGDITAGLCCLVGLLGIQLGETQHLLGSKGAVLVTYAKDHKLFDGWEARSSKMLWLPVALVALRVLCRVLPPALWTSNHCLAQSWQDQGGLQILFKTLLDCIFAVMIIYQLHIAELLNLMVGRCCSNIIRSRDAGQGVQQWNVLRCLLRRAASIMEISLVATLTAVLADLLFLGASLVLGEGPPPGCGASWAVNNLPAVLVRAGVVLGALRRAAQVTTRCIDIPQIMGAVSFSSCILDPQKQYLVRHMESSGAGFYLKGVRLQVWQVWRGHYTLAVFCVYVLMRALS